MIKSQISPIFKLFRKYNAEIIYHIKSIHWFGDPQKTVSKQ